MKRAASNAALPEFMDICYAQDRLVQDMRARHNNRKLQKKPLPMDLMREWAIKIESLLKITRLSGLPCPAGVAWPVLLGGNNALVSIELWKVALGGWSSTWIYAGRAIGELSDAEWKEKLDRLHPARTPLGFEAARRKFGLYKDDKESEGGSKANTAAEDDMLALGTGASGSGGV